jgi:hypothetical protein
MSIPGESSENFAGGPLSGRPPRRSRAVLVALSTVLLAGAGGGGFWLARSQARTDQAAAPVPPPAPAPVAATPAPVAAAEPASPPSAAPDPSAGDAPPTLKLEEVPIAPRGRAPVRAVKKKKDTDIDVRNPYR